MESSVVVDAVEKQQNLVAVTSSAEHDDASVQPSRPKASVAFSDSGDRVRTSVESISDGITSGKKSAMYPMRRGSRKQTLSLNPEEREALENLIEEVIMDGMGDGAMDSDGSSSDTDERYGEASSERGSSMAGANTVANIAAKLNNLGNVAASGIFGGKKYYPGQLKVALKHMSNLPPRFVRKLEKAQQYLDAATSAEVLARPTTIVGRIDEEEEVGTKEEMRTGLPMPNAAHSPNSSLQDRDKSKSKETKLMEAKKQIRTLLCDRDQYIDEKSLKAGITPSSDGSNAMTSKTDENLKPNVSSASVDISPGDSSVRRGTQNADMPPRSIAGGSSYISPRACTTISNANAAHSTGQDLPVQTFLPVGKLSVEVPDFVPKGSPTMPIGYSHSSASGLQSSFNMFPQYAAQAGSIPAVLQHDAYGRPVSLGSPQDPRYYVQPAVVPSQPANYYALPPPVYNTPPPTLGIPSRVVSELLPLDSGLVRGTDSNILNMNQSMPYSLSNQYPISSYSNVYSSPYQQSPSQSMQTGMYMSYPASSYGKPLATYPMPDGSISQYSAGSTGVGGRPTLDYPFGFHPQNSNSVSYPNDTVAFVSFNETQTQQHHSRTHAARGPEFSRKLHGSATPQRVHGVGTAGTPDRYNMQNQQQSGCQQSRSGGTTAVRLLSPHPGFSVRSPASQSGTPVTTAFENIVPGNVPVVSFNHSSMLENAQLANWQSKKQKQLGSDTTTISPVVSNSSQCQNTTVVTFGMQSNSSTEPVSRNYNPLPVSCAARNDSVRKLDSAKVNEGKASLTATRSITSNLEVRSLQQTVAQDSEHSDSNSVFDVEDSVNRCSDVAESRKCSPNEKDVEARVCTGSTGIVAASTESVHKNEAVVDAVKTVDARPSVTTSDDKIDVDCSGLPNHKFKLSNSSPDTVSTVCPEISLPLDDTMHCDIGLQSSQSVPNKLTVLLSSGFVERLMEMFGPQNTESRRTDQEPQRVDLNDDLLRQIYASLAKATNDDQKTHQETLKE